MRPLKIGSTEYHFTELDGVTPLEVDSFEDKVDSNEVIIWVKQSGRSKNGFYIYYTKEAPDG